MPTFTLDTNVPSASIPAGFLQATSLLIAQLLGKPESYVLVQVHPGQDLIFGGTDEPAASVTLMSIGKLGINENKKHSKAISDHIQKHLKIPANRMYIQFVDADPSTVGFNGSTFHG